MQLFFTAFADLGIFFLSTSLVIASAVAVPYCVTLLVAAIQIYILPRLNVETIGPWSIICGVVLGIIWSLSAVLTVGLWSAFSSVVALCLGALVLAAVIWFIGENNRYSAPAD